MTNLTPAHDALTTVLLACLRPEAPATLNAALAPLTPDQWEALLQLAERHGVIPLLYRRLQRPDSAAPVPLDVLQTLRGEYLSSAARNTRLYQELAGALQLLRQAEIPAIVLKGAHLAEAVYGNIALRPMGDIDLLIRRPDLPRAEAVLLENGYRSDPHNGPVMQAEHFHFVYHRGHSCVPLEIHWHILPPQEAGFVDLEGLWQRAAPATLAGGEAMVLSPADLLLHLCLHVYHHRFEATLRAFCDIAEVVRRYGDAVEWQGLSSSLQEGTARKVVYLALRLAREWLAAPVPDDALSALYAGDATEWVAALEAQILRPEASVLSLNTLELAQLWGPQPLRQKAAAFVGGLFPPAATLSLLYAAPAGSLRRYLYYPRHLRRMFAKFGRTAWQLVRGNAALRQEAARLDALDQWLHSV